MTTFAIADTWAADAEHHHGNGRGMGEPAVRARHIPTDAFRPRPGGADCITSAVTTAGDLMHWYHRMPRHCRAITRRMRTDVDTIPVSSPRPASALLN